MGKLLTVVATKERKNETAEKVENLTFLITKKKKKKVITSAPVMAFISLQKEIRSGFSSS